MTRTLRLLPAPAVVVVVVVVAACGGSSSSVSTPSSSATASAAGPRPRSACLANLARQVSQLGGRDVRLHPFTPPIGSQGCRVTSTPPGPVVTLTVDTAPQPFQRLERQIEETDQIFTPHRITPAPIDIRGVGLDASWFPALQEVLTANRRALVAVNVGWAGHTEGRRRAAATAIARSVISQE
jgi:hypothetical protein